MLIMVSLFIFRLTPVVCVPGFWDETQKQFRT